MSPTEEKLYEQLKTACRKLAKHSRLVQAEMTDRGKEGQLWENSKCAAWPDYVEARDEWYAILQAWGLEIDPPQSEPCWATIPGRGFENVMFCKLPKGHEGIHQP